MPGQHRGAARRDGDETGEDAVAQRAWLQVWSYRVGAGLGTTSARPDAQMSRQGGGKEEVSAWGGTAL